MSLRKKETEYDYSYRTHKCYGCHGEFNYDKDGNTIGGTTFKDKNSFSIAWLCDECSKNPDEVRSWQWCVDNCGIEISFVIQKLERRIYDLEKQQGLTNE